MVAVTHDPEVAERLPRTVTIRDGRVGAEGRRGEDFAVVGRDGSLTLPPDILEAVPPGSLLRVTIVERGRVVRLDRTDSGAGGAEEPDDRDPSGDPTLATSGTCGSRRTCCAGVDLHAVAGPDGRRHRPVRGRQDDAALGARRPRSAPTRALVEVDGVVPQDRDQTSAAGVVLIPQDNALASVLTASENVVVPLLAARVDPQDATRRTTEALEAVGLGSAGDQLIEELSGGQQQRVAVARGLAQQGSVVLADEPTSELDAVNRARVVLLLRAEADRGAAVVLATHDPDAAAECDAELHLDAGEATWVRPLAGAPLRSGVGE